MFKRKSQAVSMDLFMAVAVFIILITTIIFSWNLYYKRLGERMAYEDIMVNAFQISDLLVKSKGTPPGWNSTNLDIIGLASYDRNISAQKINSFTNISYDKLKELFNIERYELYFRINYLNGTAMNNYGREFNGTYSVNIRRYVIYENEKAIMDFRLWK